MTIASGEINLQSKHNLMCHDAKVKAVTSARSMADVIPFLVYSIFPLNQRFDKTKRKNILYTIEKTISVTLSVHLCFNSFWQFVSCKLHCVMVPGEFHWKRLRQCVTHCKPAYTLKPKGIWEIGSQLLRVCFLVELKLTSAVLLSLLALKSASF